ncbi:MAG: tRNA (guanosine(46)-N7)-methyltransferase TrmB [Bacteroidales bacterium]|nr:MAG: tRNA (guanosine(46)-N7)-methyltransferase TrmB [Bacteroidales bacterium]
MTKRKLERFEEMKEFGNVLQPAFDEVYQKDFRLKGRWNSDFFENDNPVVLELGCGKGEYTVELARRFKEINYIGIDIKGARMWKGAKKALAESINNAAFLRTRIELISSFFDTNEIDEIWITFPDPQPKNKKKRLTCSRFLNAYQKFLKNNGIIHLKTDNISLFNYTIKIIKHNKLEIDYSTDNLYSSIIDNEILSVKTFYENKFLEQGQNIYYVRFKLNNKTLIEEIEEDE